MSTLAPVHIVPERPVTGRPSAYNVAAEALSLYTLSLNLRDPEVKDEVDIQTVCNMVDKFCLNYYGDNPRYHTQDNGSACEACEALLKTMRTEDTSGWTREILAEKVEYIVHLLTGAKD